jgi:hypothetical protein
MKGQDRAASVRARLLNKAKAAKQDFNLVLTRYALERLLYRLSQSRHAERFLLEGALLIDLWFDIPHRPTRDADLLGFGPADIPHIDAVFRELCAAKIEPDDGIRFQAETVRAEEIRKDANYGGIRVALVGILAGARCPVQVDVGFGDAVTPAPETVDYPSMLPALPAPTLRAYPRYTVVAEKLEALVVLGIANSRMKDRLFSSMATCGSWHTTSTSMAKSSAARSARPSTGVGRRSRMGYPSVSPRTSPRTVGSRSSGGRSSPRMRSNPLRWRRSSIYCGVS